MGSLSHTATAVIGGTGLVGRELISLLENSTVPSSDIFVFASPQSKGQKIPFRKTHILVHDLEELPRLQEQLKIGFRLAYFTATKDISKSWSPYFLNQDCWVVDNSSAFRSETAVPLVVPEINGHLLTDGPATTRLVANPNCSTILTLLPLFPLHLEWGLQKLVISTYQAASGGGKNLMEKMISDTQKQLAFLEKQASLKVSENFKQPAISNQRLPSVNMETQRPASEPYGFNLYSHSSSIDQHSGYNEEELKMQNETRKILDLPDLLVSATCVRVPVLRAHSISVHAEFSSPVDEVKARHLLCNTPGVKVIDDPKMNNFPTPEKASGHSDVLVGRIRPSLCDPSRKSLSLFICGDQLLKGAALNAYQIGQILNAHQNKQTGKGSYTPI